MNQAPPIVSAPIYSMTGYATAQSTSAPSDVPDPIAFTLTLKSVNHRFLDLNLRLPGDCDSLELPLRRLIKESVKRGHVDVTLHLDRRTREATQSIQLNRELLSAHVRIFHEAAKLLHFNVEPNLNELLRMPGVLSSDSAPSAPSGQESSRGPALEAAVLALAPSLLQQLNEVRAVEGAALAAELRAAMLRLRALAEEAAALRTGAREAHFERLRTRIRELLGADALQHNAGDSAPQENAQAAGQIPPQIPTQIPPQIADRLLTEAALVAERADIEEELVRLRTHIESFLALLSAGGELGKRLDFLLQELNREANTMLSKTSSADAASGLRLTTLGLEIKTEIERAREQVQNLE